MTILLTLQFDVASDQAIRAYLAALAEQGIRVSYHNETPAQRYRPHLTLAAYEDESANRYQHVLRRFCETRKPFSVRLHHLGYFPDKCVLFIAPRMSVDLWNLHTDLLRFFSGPDWPTLKYDALSIHRWTPHCTLVPGETPQNLLRAIELCQRMWRPIDAQAVAIGAQVPPADVDEFACPLGGVGPGGNMPASIF
jgi:2'-5' RNA ligase